jgi:hypothetical protein
MRNIYYILSFCLLLFSVKLNAQTLPVGTPVLDDYYRRMQLIGQVDSNISFTVRPLFNADPTKSWFLINADTSITKEDWNPAKPLLFANGHGVLSFLPITWQQQYNSNHPYGWNDGAMIPARGYQTMVSGGVYFKLGPLSIQLRPEYVYAANKPFIGFTDIPRPIDDIDRYYFYYRDTDLPERFGNGPYKKGFLGQSSIRLTFDPISIGLSNENIWWGPGISNSLILGNSAPGFKHLTLNSVRPIKTFIGHIEFQAITGRLDETNYIPTSITARPDGYVFNVPKRNEPRYFTGFNLNYHPKWIPGLTLGLTRTFDAYQSDVKTLADYIPFFFPYQKANTNDGDPIPRDQYTSVYARWLFKKAQAEVYFEYGLNDNSNDYRDFIGSPDHSRAYLFGLRKMMNLNKDDQFIMISLESTQLSQTVDRLTRDSGTWYTHGGVRQGHTNQGQVLGAGTGPGGNLQHIDVSWVKGVKKLGLNFDRYEPNADISQSFFPDFNGHSRKWVNLAFGLNGDWNYRNLLFQAKIQHVTALNYQWILKDYTPANPYYVPHNTVYNFNGQLSVSYRF